MKKFACALLLLMAGCQTPPPAPVASAPPDPAAPFRPACAAKWQTPFAVEKCAQDELERSRTAGGTAPAGGAATATTPAAAPATPAAATPASARR